SAKPDSRAICDPSILIEVIVALHGQEAVPGVDPVTRSGPELEKEKWRKMVTLYVTSSLLSIYGPICARSGSALSFSGTRDHFLLPHWYLIRKKSPRQPES